MTKTSHGWVLHHEGLCRASKDAFVVLSDADLDRAVGAALWGGFYNAGQICVSTERVYVTHDMRCIQEETFGPTLPVIKVADDEEAIRLANDSGFGLAATVFSRDRGLRRC